MSIFGNGLGSVGSWFSSNSRARSLQNAVLRQQMQIHAAAMQPQPPEAAMVTAMAGTWGGTTTVTTREDLMGLLIDHHPPVPDFSGKIAEGVEPVPLGELVADMAQGDNDRIAKFL